MKMKVYSPVPARMVAAPIAERRNSRLPIPIRRAFRSHSSRARRMVSVMTGECGSGSYSAFEQGPNLMGSPGSSSRQSTEARLSSNSTGSRQAGKTNGGPEGPPFAWMRWYD